MRVKIVGLLVGAAALVLPVAGALSGEQAAASTPSSPAPASAPTRTPTCVINPSPANFVETGLGSVASSVVYELTVECKPVFSGQSVQINAEQLNNACHNTLSWYSATATAGGSAPGTGTGQTFTVVLDGDGNANAVVWGGPSCAQTKDLITAELLVAPYATAKTHVTVGAPMTTPPALHAYPSQEVEDATTSSVAAIFYAEFPSVHAGQTVEFSDAQLAARCPVLWVGADEQILGYGASVTTTLDDNGNAFVVALAGPSCASGRTLAQADLVGASYRTLTANFSILSPRPTA